MTEVLSLIAGMALGVLVCVLVVAVIAWIWRERWRTALVYFGLAEEGEETEDAEPAAEAGLVVHGRSLGPTRTFDWPRAGRRATGH
jgi:hypothetical protein